MSIKRTYSLFFVLILFFFITFFLYYSFFMIPHLRKSLILEKQNELIHHLEFAEKLLISRFTDKKNHSLKEYLDYLEKMNYGKEITYYFAISKEGILLMHPFRKDLVGKNVKSFQDKDGVFVFLEILQAVKEDNFGFAYYSWDNPAQSKELQEKKMTCVKFLKDFDIAIGTGIYFSDIDQKLKNIKKNLFIYTIGLIALILSLIIFLMTIFKTTLEKLYYEEIIGDASFDNEFQFMGLLDTKGRLKKVNNTALNALGDSSKKNIGKYFWDTPWWDIDEKTTEKLQDSIKKASEGITIRYQVKNKIKNNKIIEVDFTLRPIFSRSGKVIHLLAEGRDITDLLRFKDDSNLKTTFIDTLLSQAPNALIVFDNNLKRHKTNKLWEDLKIKDKIENILISKANEIIKKNSNIINEEIHFPESSKYYNITIFPVKNKENFIEAFIGTAIDITNKCKVEQHIIKTKKMASVGKIAKKLLNEINNPVSSILQSIQNLDRRLDIYNDKNTKICKDMGLDIELLKKYLEMRNINELFNLIKDSENRLVKIIDDLNFYITSDVGSKETFNINDFLDQIKDYVLKNTHIFDDSQKEVIDSILVQKDLSYNLKEIPVNIENFKHAIINIFVNSIEALFEKQNNKKINISTYSQNNKIVIEIVNNGPVIDHKIIDNIFEPFISSKDQDHNGNGLFYSYYVITQEHNGDLFVESNHKETRFIIKLPI